MYNIDKNFHSPREDIVEAFAACVVHANALIDFYNEISSDLIVSSDSFFQGKLKEELKLLVYQCREQLQAIPIEVSQVTIPDDLSIIRYIHALRQYCKTEVAEVIVLRDQLTPEDATPVYATVVFNALKNSKKIHVLKLNYYVETEQTDLRKILGKKSASGKQYMKVMKSNATTQFFDDANTVLAACLDDVNEKYSECVTYKVGAIETGDTLTYTNLIVSANFSGMMKSLLNQYAHYQSLRQYAQANDVVSPTISEAFFETKVEPLLKIESTKQRIGQMHETILQLNQDGVTLCSFEIIDIICYIMRAANLLEYCIDTLNQYKKTVVASKNRETFLCMPRGIVQDEIIDFPMQEAQEVEIREVLPQVATITHVHVAPASAEPMPAAVTPVTTPAPDDFIVNPSYENEITVRCQKAISRNRTKTQYAEENLSKAKNFDRDVLALFFRTPVPHFEMSEKQFFAFMTSIGATCNHSSGNGSSVKISLDPQSVLIAPKDQLSSSAMNIHVQHKSGHNLKSVPGYVIKNALKFFERAGIYQFLYAENEKALDRKNKPSFG